jgi:hypothetical protein
MFGNPGRGAVLTGGGVGIFYINSGCANLTVKNIRFNNFEKVFYHQQDLTLTINSISIDDCQFDIIGYAAINLEVQITKARITNNIFKNINEGASGVAVGIILGDDDFETSDVLGDYLVADNLFDTIQSNNSEKCSGMYLYGDEVTVRDNVFRDIYNADSSEGAYAMYVRSRFANIRGNKVVDCGTTAAIQVKGAQRSEPNRQVYGVVVSENILRWTTAYPHSPSGIMTFNNDIQVIDNYFEYNPGSATIEFAEGSGVLAGNTFWNCGMIGNGNGYWIRAGSSADTTKNLQIHNNRFEVTLDADTAYDISHRMLRIMYNQENLQISDNVFSLDTFVNDSANIIDVGASSTASKNISITNNLFDFQGAFERYALVLLGANTNGIRICNNTVAGNELSNKAMLYAVNTPGSDVVMRDNIGAITENSGTATLTSGTTSKNVTHGITKGCGIPPISAFNVTPQETLGSASFFWVDTVTNSNFNINVNTNPSTDVDFSWSVIAHTPLTIGTP